MKPVKQEDKLGCAVACVAFILNIPYAKALISFLDGNRRAKEKANFYCPEIVQIFNNAGYNYTWKKILENSAKEIYNDYSVSFIERSKNYPYGHFLARYNRKWMDPWINLPDKSIQAGFRNELPGKPTYVIYRI